MCGFVQLVAGSGTTQNQDETDNAPIDENSTHSGKADDGYSAGVPGPLTRLFVIANRGIANLIQDLILVSIIMKSSMYFREVKLYKIKQTCFDT